MALTDYIPFLESLFKGRAVRGGRGAVRSSRAGRGIGERLNSTLPSNTRSASSRPVTERPQQKNRIVRPQDKKPTLLQRIGNWHASLGHLRVLVVAAITLGLLVIAFYSPVKVWYTAYRDKQLYALQLQVLAEQNKKLQSEVDRLQSQEGIEDEARKRGYVKANETSVTIKGKTTTNGEADAGASKDELEEVKTKNPWYINVLDKFFMYKPSKTHV